MNKSKNIDYLNNPNGKELFSKLIIDRSVEKKIPLTEAMFDISEMEKIELDVVFGLLTKELIGMMNEESKAPKGNKNSRLQFE